MTPNTLADDIGISPKRLRQYFRDVFPRPIEKKNTNWVITPEMERSAREYFQERN